uniref:EF-hand domain-containing protein n=1 Tax=Caenorhabditis tropicalis TaxID=1561998 RepID=A0A1I7UJE3_9PELO
MEFHLRGEYGRTAFSNRAHSLPRGHEKHSINSGNLSVSHEKNLELQNGRSSGYCRVVLLIESTVAYINPRFPAIFTLKMRLLFLFFLVAFAAAFIKKDTSLDTATKINALLDQYSRDQKDWKIMPMLLEKFYYQDCKGKMYDREEFINLMMRSKILGKVTSARPDKNHIIYKVTYGSEMREIMITKKENVWMFDRGQALIC